MSSKSHANRRRLKRDRRREARGKRVSPYPPDGGASVLAALHALLAGGSRPAEAYMHPRDAYALWLRGGGDPAVSFEEYLAMLPVEGEDE